MALLNMLRRNASTVPTPDAGRSIVFMDNTTRTPSVKHDDGSVSTLAGPTGATGPTGPVGLTGLTGATGPAGAPMTFSTLTKFGTD